MNKFVIFSTVFVLLIVIPAGIMIGHHFESILKEKEGEIETLQARVEVFQKRAEYYRKTEQLIQLVGINFPPHEQNCTFEIQIKYQKKIAQAKSGSFLLYLNDEFTYSVWSKTVPSLPHARNMRLSPKKISDSIFRVDFYLHDADEDYYLKIYGASNKRPVEYCVFMPTIPSSLTEK